MSPVAADGKVFCPTADGVVALALDDGGIVWRADDVAGTGIPVPTGDGLVVPTTDGLTMLDARDGSQRWMDSTEARLPTVSDGTVSLGTGDGLIGRSLSDGSERWRVDRGRFLMPPVVTPEGVYAVERPGEAGDATFAFDRMGDSSPEPRWCSAVGEAAVTGAADDALFAVQSGGVVEFTADFGDAEWRYSPGRRVRPPAVLDGCVVRATTDGTVAWMFGTSLVTSAGPNDLVGGVFGGLVAVLALLITVPGLVAWGVGYLRAGRIRPGAALTGAPVFTGLYVGVSLSGVDFDPVSGLLLAAPTAVMAVLVGYDLWVETAPSVATRRTES